MKLEFFILSKTSTDTHNSEIVLLLPSAETAVVLVLNDAAVDALPSPGLHVGPVRGEIRAVEGVAPSVCRETKRAFLIVR